MVGWLSDRVLSLLKRNLTDKSNNIHRNNLFCFFIEKVLVRVAGHILKATVTWGATPSRLGTRPKPTVKDWVKISWRSTVKNKTSLYWSWWTVLSVIASGLAGTGVKLAKKSVYLGWQLNSDIQEMVCRWAEWKCSSTTQQFLDQGKSPWNKWTLEWPILLESKCPLWYCLQEAALGLTGIKAESIVIQLR